MQQQTATLDHLINKITRCNYVWVGEHGLVIKKAHLMALKAQNSQNKPDRTRAEFFFWHAPEEVRPTQLSY